MSERFGILRSLLQQAPSQDVWRTLCEELGLWGEEERESVALPYVVGHLDKWPDAVERGVGRLKGEQEWMWGLANTLRSPSMEVLERIAAGEGARRVRRIEMYSVGDHAGLVGRFEGLREYGIELYGEDYALLYALLGARWPASLRALSLRPIHGELRGDDVWVAEQIAQNPTLGGLEVLELGEMKLREEGALKLAQSPHLKGLRRLDLSWNEIGEAGARALADSANMAGVVALELSGEALGAGLAALLSSPHLGALRELVVSQGEISPGCVEALRGVAGPPALEELVIKDCTLRGEVLAALAEAPVMRAVRELTLDRRVEGWAAARLLASEHLSGLRKLRLPPGQDEAVLLALAQNEALAGLEWLSMEGCTLGERVCEALATSAVAGRLHTLSLNGCGGDVVELLERGAWGALRGVFIGDERELGAKVDDAGASRLAACEALRGVERLNLSGNQIGDEGARALAASPHLSGLRGLFLHRNQIGDVGACALVESAGLGGLVQLGLGANRIGDAGALALAASARLGVDGHNGALARNQIGDAGMLALVRSPHLGPHSRLDLSDNLITDAGILALAAEPALGRLEGNLSFDTERVSDEAWRALLDSPYAREELSKEIRFLLQKRRYR